MIINIRQLNNTYFSFLTITFNVVIFFKMYLSYELTFLKIYYIYNLYNLALFSLIYVDHVNAMEGVYECNKNHRIC